MQMLVNICCSGSSGSTFFSQLLNNHPDVVCGNELGLFSKPIFYDNFKKLRRWTWLIKRYGISSQPYFRDRSIIRNIESYGIDRNTIWRWVKKSGNLNEFVARLHNHIRYNTSKSIWAEKTPENIFLIESFANYFPKAKIIHIIRDPRDVILSLMKRGHSHLSAAKVWLTSVASIQRVRKNKNLLEIRYENIVNDPGLVFQKVCSHLEISYDLDFFLKDKYKTANIKLFEGFKTWQLKPNHEISKNAVGKYKLSHLDFTKTILMRITKEFALHLGVRQFSISELMNIYGYHNQKKNIDKIKYTKLIDNRISFRSRLIYCLLNEKSPFPLVEY
jgi:hypothetical protein